MGIGPLIHIHTSFTKSPV